MAELPRFTAGSDPGSSFFQLLTASEAQRGLGNRGDIISCETGWSAPTPDATTIVAIRSADGVVIAGDRRATMGHAIDTRDIRKVFRTDRFSAVGIAGAAGPAVEMVRLFQVELEHYEKVEGTALTLEGKANRLSTLVRSNLSAAMAGLAVVPLFVGFDRRAERGRVFKYDLTGGRYEEGDFYAIGSGSIHARNWIKAKWSPDQTTNDAVALAIASLINAADEDAGTGGPDFIRGIYPIVATISADGFSLVDNDVVADLARSLVEDVIR
ncbi:MAG: proteasome subunit beta [Acidimicrobiia bacterium]|nr:proteasome subunit beta [Acidimicrobiia bacterium]MBP8179565.1 proteasome subunit beta [Acidimicrobiia bacterium]